MTEGERYHSLMPKETDAERLRLLSRLLLRSVGDLRIERRAWDGSNEPDDIGLYALFRGWLTDPASGQALVSAMVDYLRTERVPNRVDVPGDREFQFDAETRYEFRLTLAGQRVYVKTLLDMEDEGDPVLVIKCVKRRN